MPPSNQPMTCAADHPLPAPTPSGPAAPDATAASDSRSDPAAGARGLLLLGVLLVAVNLRAAVTSVGALLPEVSAGLHLSGTMTGLLTTLPVLVFAAGGAGTPWLARRAGIGVLFGAAMAVLAVGQLLRVTTSSPAVFLLTSALALSGIAVANVVLPAYVRRAFPRHAGLVTGAYTMALTAGTGIAAATSVPVANAFGSWRDGLGAWALLAAIAVVPWLFARPAGPAHSTVDSRVRPGRTRLGWLMALYFGAQSLGAYAVMGWLAQLFRDAGFSASTAGLLLAAVTVLGVPIALLVPAHAARGRGLRTLVWVLGVATLVAYLGLAVAPRAGALGWVALIAVGQATFPLVLTLIGMRARTEAGAVALSAFAQSVGYVLAAVGPLAVGALYDLTGGWDLPLLFLGAVMLGQTAVGLAIARPRYIEDEARPAAGIPGPATRPS